MARTAIATHQTIWDCRFSRPGFRLFGLAVPQQPESLWLCTRDGRRRGVTEEECERCPHWEKDDSPES
jgi:hypothetical protein